MTIDCLMLYMETESQWKEDITYITSLVVKGKGIQLKLPWAPILSWFFGTYHTSASLAAKDVRGLYQ